MPDLKKGGKALKDACDILRRAGKILEGHGNNGDAARMEAVASTWEEYYGQPED